MGATISPGGVLARPGWGGRGRGVAGGGGKRGSSLHILHCPRLQGWHPLPLGALCLVGQVGST